ncbi:MAG: ABC transporter substrate-binding protein [Bacteroidales bacterium]
MRKMLLYTAIFALLLTSVSCCNNNTNSEQENNSDSLQIVTLTPSITKQLLLLGLEDNVIGHTSFCPSDKLVNSELVASAAEVNVEKIAVLDPDIVLVSTLTKEKVIKNLRKVGVEVKYLDMPRSFDEICGQMIKLGELLDKKDKAAKIVARQRKRLDSLRHTIPESEKVKFLIQIGAKPLYAATSESFMHDYIKYAQGENIAAGLSSGTLSRESVLKKNPDVIVIVTMGMAGKEEKEIWQGYPNLKATKNDQVHIIDSDEASSPTPVTFVNVLDTIIEMVYKNDSKH